MLFEGGPWDKAAADLGVHVFSKKRKLLYGDEHNNDEHNEDGTQFAPRELHKMHSIWRRGALKMLQETCRRTKGEVKLEKVASRNYGGSAWPGDLGKHHALVEEMVELGVLTIHQTDAAVVFALVHRQKLDQAVQTFITAPAKEAAAAAQAPAPAPATNIPAFEPADSFLGARAGCVFKKGAQGIGYYRDGPAADATDGAAASGTGAGDSLPPGWVQGAPRRPLGRRYCWVGHCRWDALS